MQPYIGKAGTAGYEKVLIISYMFEHPETFEEVTKNMVLNVVQDYYEHFAKDFGYGVTMPDYALSKSTYCKTNLVCR